MALELFGRKCQLTLTVPNKGEFFSLQPNATRITDMRVKFKIEKTREAQPNTCNVTIHNLNPEHRAAFAKKPLHVRLDAGYESEGLKRLFQGDLIWGHSSKPSDTWMTSLDIGDGARAYRHARSSRTFKAGTSARTVIADLAKTMGLSIPKSVSEAKEFTKQFGSGVTVEGPSRREMDRLMKSTGHGWSIQSGRLQVLKKGDYNQVEAILMSQATGVLGTPDYGPPKDPKSRPVLTLRSYLDPRLEPGGPIKVDMRDVKGLFVVRKVTHSGDTLGSEWYTTIEAHPYG